MYSEKDDAKQRETEYVLFAKVVCLSSLLGLSHTHKRHTENLRFVCFN